MADWTIYQSSMGSSAGRIRLEELFSNFSRQGSHSDLFTRQNSRSFTSKGRIQCTAEVTMRGTPLETAQRGFREANFRGLGSLETASSELFHSPVVPVALGFAAG